MAKRFSETTKWNDDWFMGLEAPYKLFWLYLLDNVDHAGFWKVNFKLAAFQIGSILDPSKVLETFKGKIQIIEDDLWFIPKFIEFQYGTLHENNRFHASVINRLRKYSQNEGPSKALKWSMLDAKEQEQVQYKDKVQVKRGIVKGGVSKSDIEAVYALYPRKVGKVEGIAKAFKELKTPSDLKDFKLSVAKYRDYCERSKLESQYIKHFSSFITSWREWLDPAAGSAENFAVSTDTASALDEWRREMDTKDRLATNGSLEVSDAAG